MSNLTGAELIRAILDAELRVCEAENEAEKLRKQYAEEAKEFHKSEIVEILRGYGEPEWVRGTVVSYGFRTNPFGIYYTVSLRKSDWSGDGFRKVSGANIRKVNAQ